MSFRVVLDTNCIISALVFSRQKMSWLRHRWQTGEIIPLVKRINGVVLDRFFGLRT